MHTPAYFSRRHVLARNRKTETGPFSHATNNVQYESSQWSHESSSISKSVLVPFISVATCPSTIGSSSLRFVTVLAFVGQRILFALAISRSSAFSRLPRGSFGVLGLSLRLLPPVLSRTSSTALFGSDVARDTDISKMAEKIDGKAIAATIRQEIRDQVTKMQEEYGRVPGLAVILVGSRRDSQTYVNMKKKACADAGIVSVGYDFSEDVTQEELLETIRKLNVDNSIHGILVQLPLPKHINQDHVLQSVDPSKDVDGLHPVNVAALQLHSGEATSAPFSIPCTPLGCLVLLDRSGVVLKGANCVVVGRSHLVGLPMARLLLGRDATVTIVHSKTKDIASIVRQADVVVAAVGKADLVKGDWLKPGAVVIDVGINSVDIEPTTPGGKPYKLVGDVDYEEAVKVCSKITPVPGGVGPMTIAMLLSNTLRSCERASHTPTVGGSGY